MAAANLSNIVVNSTKSAGVLDEETFEMLFALFMILTIIIATFGTLGNIFTLIVYSRMGFSETTNISLTALTMSDLGMNITSILTVLFFILPPTFLYPLTPEVAVPALGYPHHALARVSALITAFLSIERYLCVSCPHKIRQVITHRRTSFIMITMFIVALLPLVTVYFKYPIGWRYFPEYNSTLIGLRPVNDPAATICFQIYQLYSSVVLPVATFMIVIICATLLASNLRRRRARRDANRHPASHPSAKISTSTMNSKEIKVVKMVIAIATVFIVCNIPSCVHMVVVLVVPEFDVDGKYWDLFLVAGSAFFVTDSINTSANVFIYYNLSTRFRQTATGLFPWRNKNGNQGLPLTSSGGSS